MAPWPGNYLSGEIVDCRASRGGTGSARRGAARSLVDLTLSRASSVWRGGSGAIGMKAKLRTEDGRTWLEVACDSCHTMQPTRIGAQRAQGNFLDGIFIRSAMPMCTNCKYSGKRARVPQGSPESATEVEIKSLNASDERKAQG
jgi:hypothetical protein